MNLKFKKPSKETQMAMSKLAISKDGEDYFKIAEDKICDFTKHNQSKLVNSGNAAILLAMNSIEGAVLIPDQGGWNGFRQIANFLNKKIITIKTNQGIIENSYLEEAILENYELLSNNQNALFLTSFAGYTAEHNIKEISKFLHNHDILLVEDASGSISDSKEKLANGDYSDIIIGSTGSPKIVNVGFGGFISTNNSEVFDKSRLILKTSKINDITACGIATELDFAKDNLKTTMDACKYLKNNLTNVIHEDKRGINIIIKSDDSKSLAYKLRNEFALDNYGMITNCPNYNRLKEKAVAIEIKNLDVSSLNKSNLDKIIDIVNKY